MKKSFKFIVAFTICLLANSYSKAQDASYKIMFFNTENYFDTFDDSITLDNEFLPTGSYHWTWDKFTAKRNALAKVVVAVGQGQMPAIVGLCEIENRFVLNQLVRETILAKIGYRIVHRDSPDARGIDVAMLYNPADFELLYSSFHAVSHEFRTREILYAKGILGGADTIHIFVNHFPSKRGGAKESESRRTVAARELRRLCDSVLAANANANIFIMGDFNDTPDSAPIVETLQASADFANINSKNIYNLTLPLARAGVGSIKFQGVWEFIDLMFVSGNMLGDSCKICCKQSDFAVFKSPVFMEKDKAFTGEKPKRTFIGMKYNGGISDHLPVYLQLSIKKPQN